MSYLRTKGIVIKEVNTGEADKIISIFSIKNGKLTAAARGSRRPKSRLAASTQFLCYSDFMLYKGKDMYQVNSGDVIEPFYSIRNDIVKLTYSAHMVDIINDVVQENQPSVRVLQLFLNSLHMLANTDRPPDLITRIFELRLLSIIGYAPTVNCCAVCGSNSMEKVSFSFRNCGFLCGREECISRDRFAVQLSSGAAKAIYHIVHSKPENLFSFNLSQEVLDELGRVVKRYLRERLEKDYNKLDFLKTL